MKNTNAKRMFAAAGLALATAPALAGITWNHAPQTTLFQDDNIDFALTVDTADPGYDAGDPDTWVLIPDTDDTLNIGDVLVAVVEYNTSAGVSILPQELTGISVIQAASIAGPVIEFEPYLGTAIPGTGFTWGGGAMLALWLDPTPNLAIDAGLVPGGLSCSSLVECVGQATDGTLWEVDGFIVDDAEPDDDDNFWTALGTGVTYSDILDDPTATIRGFYNAGLDVIYNGTGENLALNSFPGTPGRTVDVLLNGTINGGGAVDAAAIADLQSLIDDGYAATTDTDLQKRLAVPVPAPLALLGAGLLGLRFVRRRKA